MFYNHQFQRFKDVEIADFNDEQKKAFVERWFNKEPQTAERCWEKMQADKSILELACVPLLLTLLCISFEENNDFPRNRATLYSHAIDALLRKWDSSRRIDRGEIYKNLTLPLKEALLATLAYHTFVENQYFVAEERFCDLIKNFIQHLPNQDESRLYPDSAIILRGIDAQHSLITQRAEQVYSFSHLTLQEYFTAKYLLDNDYCTNLAQNYLSQGRWREVFLLTTNLLLNSMRKSEALSKSKRSWHWKGLWIGKKLYLCMEEKRDIGSLIPDTLSDVLLDAELPALATAIGTSGKSKRLRVVRHFTENARKAILAQINQGIMTISEASREYKVSLSTLYQWRYRYEQIKPQKIQLMDIQDFVVERQRYETRLAELEQIIGRQTVTIAYLEKALSLATGEDEAQKKSSAAEPLTGSAPTPKHTTTV